MTRGVDHGSSTTPEPSDRKSNADRQEDRADPWTRYLTRLRALGVPSPGAWRSRKAQPATLADEQALYDVAPSFVDLLPWVEYLPDSRTLLLDDGKSVAAFFEISPVGTEGREAVWLDKVRDALEDALQDSFEELEQHPWVLQLYVQDETGWDPYLEGLREYVRPRARGSAFTERYLALTAHHLKSIAKPGGLFEDTAVTRLPWRGQTRRVRLVAYRRIGEGAARGTLATRSARGASTVEAISTVCDRLAGGLANAGIKAMRLEAPEIHAWLLRWFNPQPVKGGTPQDAERFYRQAAYPEEIERGEFELASGTDFSQRLFFREPRSHLKHGVWYFDGQPHRAIALDRLRRPPALGLLTGERRASGDAVKALFDELPEGTIGCLTLVATPQDILESHLNYLARKSVGETLDSEQTREDVREARSIIGRSHKLYRGALTFYLRGRDLEELDARTSQLVNALLAAGLQPVREEDDVAPLNTYLRWLPGCFDPAKDRRQWYTQLFFAQHLAHLAPFWGRSQGTGHPGITFFNRGGGTITFDPLNSLDRQMNAHLFLFGPTGSGKSATLNYILNQVTAIYRPRIFIVEAGNSFGLFGEWAKRLGLTVHRVTLAPGSGVTLAPFADAVRLVGASNDADELSPDAESGAESDDSDANDQRDVLGELEITARLMITGGEDKEEARMTRADRSLIRQCIMDAARDCVQAARPVLTESIRDALRERSADPTLPEARRIRLAEMADALDIFCQGANGELFNRPGSPWPEVDITIVDLAAFAREGYNAELSAAYISLLNAVNNIAERDQFLGRPIVNVTDEGHIITKNPLLAPYILKITKMWRKLGAWFWLATQNVDDFPKAAEPMLNMIEWWICLNMPPDEVEKIARFRELTAAQKSLMLSARKESRKFSEGVVLSKSMEVLFRVVPPSIYLALAMTESEEKSERYRLMQQHGLSELDAALHLAADLDRARGIDPLPAESRESNPR
ncbi:MAG: conjugative transfer ATPase [Gammaproteobacteria bacterium]|nr:conjugative transfer ATPase [Gammaproteobacteria bacterium]